MFFFNRPRHKSRRQTREAHLLDACALGHLPCTFPDMPKDFKLGGAVSSVVARAMRTSYKKTDHSGKSGAHISNVET